MVADCSRSSRAAGWTLHSAVIQEGFEELTRAETATLLAVYGQPPYGDIREELLQEALFRRDCWLNDLALSLEQTRWDFEAFQSWKKKLLQEFVAVWKERRLSQEQGQSTFERALPLSRALTHELEITPRQLGH